MGPVDHVSVRQTWLEEAVSKESPLLLGGGNAGAAVTCVELGLGNVHRLVGLVKELRRQSYKGREVPCGCTQ